MLVQNIRIFVFCGHHVCITRYDCMWVYLCRSSKTPDSLLGCILWKKRSSVYVCACTCACVFMHAMFNNSFIVFQAASTVSGGIILTQPYDPRVKKQKLKPYDRKLRLDLLHSDPTSTSKSQDASTSSSTSSVSTGVSGTGFCLVL